MSFSGSGDESRRRRLRVARSGVRDPLDPHHWAPLPVAPPVPRRFCDPVEAFGDPNALERTWLPPADAAQVREWLEFREAVLQHAICVAVRRHPQSRLLRQRLVELDGRSNASARWNALLSGRRLMSLEDVAFLLLHVADALPERDAVSTLLAVAGKQLAPPPEWAEVDR